MVAGALLVGWIVVEVLVIRTFSVLQPAFGLIGAGVLGAGYRHWHLAWGATDEEVRSSMPGDDLPTPGWFVATRAVTIAADPGDVWPWLVQVGRGRPGFYSYDVLDNGGRPSSRSILPEFQTVVVGSLAAPMATRPAEATSFVVASAVPGSSLVWSKADAVWSWRLTPELSGTRLVVRLRTGPVWRRPLHALAGGILLEVGDFPMMRKMLLGIRERAESLASVLPFAPPAGLEPATVCLEGSCSIPLSYGGRAKASQIPTTGCGRCPRRRRPTIDAPLACPRGRPGRSAARRAAWRAVRVQPRIEIGIDCDDPGRLAPVLGSRARVRGRRPRPGGVYLDLVPPEPGLPVVYLQRVPEPKSTKNRLHLDLFVDDPHALVERLIGLGATRSARR